MTTTRELGEKGENLAVQYLTNLGYKILDRNWHYGHKELDIIAKDGEMLVIVEVKSTSGLRFNHPSEAVTQQKIRHIIDAAEAYILDHDLNFETRFDVVTVIFWKNNHELEHFKDAFYPGM